MSRGYKRVASCTKDHLCELCFYDRFLTHGHASASSLVARPPSGIPAPSSLALAHSSFARFGVSAALSTPSRLL